jgi:opacity protein-like surface antigen
MIGFKCSQKRHPILFILMIGTAMMFMFSLPVQGQDDLCVSDIGGLAGNPDIDGVVEDDAGWNGATRVNLSADLGVTRSAVFQLGKRSGFFYISFVVDTPVPGSDNTIVLVFSTDGNPAHDWRIHIQPFDVGIVNGTNQVPHVVTYWRDSITWNNAGATANTAAPGFWLKDNTKFSKDPLHWAIEIKIPIETNVANASLDSKIYFPSASTFSLYANVLSTSVLLGTYTQDPWPAGNIITPGVSSFLTRNTPPSSDWGTLSLFSRPACTGVSLVRSNIGVKDPLNLANIINSMRRYTPLGGFPETNMSQCDALANNHLWPGTKGPLNIFVAKPLNGMAAAKPVSAEFRVANWGIPGPNDWRPIGEVAGGLGLSPPTVPATGSNTNPTPQSSIAPATFGDLTSTWELSYKQSCLYSHRPHQCIQVNLDSTDPSTIFLNKSVQRNMDFVTASTFTQDAEISARGYGSPPGGSSNHGFVITVDTEVIKYGKQKDYIKYSTETFNWVPQKSKEAMAWVARGYIKTGKYLIINDKKYEYTKAVGGFGYVAEHTGDVKNWHQHLEGEGLEKIKDDIYTIGIPPGKVAGVTTTIEAVDDFGPGVTGDLSPFAIIVRGGIAIPHGDFSEFWDPGASFHLGLEYLINNVISAEAIVGYHRFKNSILADDLKVWQFSLNGRLYLMKTQLRSFVNAGVGFYNFNPGDSEFGYNGGGGLQYALTLRFSLEAAYNYHIINTNGSNFKFSTVQGGFRLRF